MVAKGRVQNGVVVLGDDVRLSEGQEVTVVIADPEFGSSHSLLDIPTVSLGQFLPSASADVDLLSEMLEGRP